MYLAKVHGFIVVNDKHDFNEKRLVFTEEGVHIGVIESHTSHDSGDTTSIFYLLPSFSLYVEALEKLLKEYDVNSIQSATSDWFIGC